MMTTISNGPKQPTHRVAILAVVKILAVISVAEAAVMVILQATNLRDGWRTVLDPIMLTGLTAPLLYRYVAGPTRDALQQRRQAEERLKETAVALRSANKVLQGFKNSAEAAMRAKSEFLANMSHEICTLMTAILGYIDLIAEGCPKQCDFGRSEAAGRIDTIKRNSDHLLRLMDRTLDLTKIESGKMEIEQVTCWPCRIVSDVVPPMKVRSAARGLSLEVEHD
ncbi:MAG: sensor histidine kinase [Planctomycetota bacterium]|jgi:signal transduction histidine kinase